MCKRVIAALRKFPAVQNSYLPQPASHLCDRYLKSETTESIDRCDNQEKVQAQVISRSLSNGNTHPISYNVAANDPESHWWLKRRR